MSEKLSRAPYAQDFRTLFGERVFDDPQQAFLDARQALQAYELESPEFAPFTSKYDLFLAGGATLSPAEMRGLQLFDDPQKGNCAACHPSGRGFGGEPPLFTDFTYDDLGCRAMRRSKPTRTRTTSIWVCAGHPGPISPGARICAERSMFRHCATWR